MAKYEETQESDLILETLEETVSEIYLETETEEEAEKPRKQPFDKTRAKKKQDELVSSREEENEERERAEAALMIAETETEAETEPETTIAETGSPQMIYLGAYRITFYDNCPACCGQWAYMGITNSGAPCQASHTIACGYDIPFGTVIYIEGLGTYVCEDRGVPSGCIDIYVNNHSEIPSWGCAYMNCYVVQY